MQDLGFIFLYILIMNPYVYVGLGEKQDIIPKLDEDDELLLKQVLEIVGICKEYFNIPEEKRTRNNTTPEKYISLLVAFDKLRFPSYNKLAVLIENKEGFPLRSAIIITLKKYSAIVRYDRELKKAYKELLNLVTIKLKL